MCKWTKHFYNYKGYTTAATGIFKYNLALAAIHIPSIVPHRLTAPGLLIFQVERCPASSNTLIVGLGSQ